MPRFRMLRADRLTTRCAFIRTIAGGVLAVPLAAAAQQAGKVHRIGYLSVQPASPFERKIA